jgi:hypothetical protein
MSYARRPLFVVLLVLAMFGACACSPTQQKPVIATVLDSEDSRHTSFEATLRVLDQHPEYVDELFAQARRHPATLDRLLQDTAQHLDEPDLAKRTAVQLSAAPAGLKATLVASLDDMQDKPKALKAAAEAIESRPKETAHMLVQSDDAIRRTMHALVVEVHKTPESEAVFREALSQNSDALAAIITKDPELTGVLFKSIAKSGLKRGSHEFDAFLHKFNE